MNTRSHTTENKPRRKFVLIAKVDNTNFVKYRANDLDNAIKFILKKFSGTRFINIFSNKGIDRGKLVYTYGSRKGLEPAK